MMVDLDLLLDQALAEGELMAGHAPGVVAARNPGVAVSREVEAAPAPAKAFDWTPEEEQFVREHVGYYTVVEIGAVLGRSEQAIKIRRQRAKFRCPGYTKHPDFLTAQAAARALGVDSHAVILLHERGILPDTWRLGDRGVRLVRRVTFLRWAVNPRHWCYFWRSIRQPERLGDRHLRRLIVRQRERWNDDWWTPGETAVYHGVQHHDVNRYIRAGKIAATKWGNWWILRSEATRPDLRFFRGTGAAQRSHWTRAADEFVLRARGQGHSWEAIARMMKKYSGWIVRNHYHYLTESNE